MLKEVLTASLNQAEVKLLPHFLGEIVDEFDPDNKGYVKIDDCIETLVKPYC